MFARPETLDAAPAISPVERLEIGLLFEAIFRQYGHDFRSYALSSVRRRVHKRLEAEGLSTISALQDRVLRDVDAMARLLADLSISVTSMFRDPSFFRALREQVVPVLRERPVFRVWDAGCATGEEVYSLAIMLREEGLLDRATIYATDMSSEAVAAARNGLFSLSTMQENSANYLRAGGSGSLSDHYSAGSAGACFDPRLRERVVFARHNLVTDPAFAEFDLIVCRNVLIYFGSALKDHVLGTFTESLTTSGILALGRSEAVRFTAVEERYDELEAAERIYRLRPDALAIGA